MRCFVTGGAGFIGSHLVDKLISIGPVTVYDNLSSGKKEFLQQHDSKKGFRFLKADLLDLDNLKEVMAGHEVVFHLAANSDARIDTSNIDRDLEQGIIATNNVLKAMVANRIKKIIFASSSVVFGETPVVPVEEDHGPLQPISLYGASKLACEGLITAFSHLFGMQVWIFRFANVVGSRATHGVVLDFINKLKRNPRQLEILGDGTQEKPYIYVSDCIDGILLGFQHSHKPINVFNLGTDSTTDVTRVARIVVEEIGFASVRFKYTGGVRGWPGDVPQVRLNVTKLKKLGWKPRNTSDEAIRHAVKELLAENGEMETRCRRLS